MPVERISKSFKDISMTFQTNPLNSDLIGLKNESAIARSVRNIVFTLPGEKFFSPNFGSDVSRSLFENINDVGASVIEDQISRSIQKYEPRVRLITTRAIADPDNNAFDVTIVYEIIGIDVQPQELQLVLQPTR